MAAPLLKTKLFIPQVAQELVVRRRLQQQLSAGSERQLILVSAPAGFGKTTTVAAWAAANSRTAWLSLDTGDNDLRRFLTYLAAALQQVEGKFAQELPPLLNAARLPDAETLVALLTEQMHGSKPFLLILDDYHTIQEPAIHQLLETLLAYQPRSLHLALITREDPPLPLPRLRARGELLEIRNQDLRFTPAEAERFLNEVMGLDLSRQQIRRLDARTEGWIAGLQLAAFSLRSHPNRASFVDAFAGDDRYILDYLMDEVFAQQSSPVQQFLLQTSILERLSAGLCNAVMATAGLSAADCQQLLEQLEAANLFIISLDRRRHWYRYHHLFADLLRYRLQQQMPALVPALHRRASLWYEEHGYLREAVEHALTGDDGERTAHLIEEHGRALFAANEMKAVLDWMEQLPSALSRRRPRLLMVRAWAALATGYPEQTQRSLARIEERFGVTVEAWADGQSALDASSRGALAEVAITRAVVATGRDEAQRAVALSQAALPVLTEGAATLFHGPLDLRGVALSNLAIAEEMLGDLSGARAALSEALAISRKQGNPHIVALAGGRLGRLSAQQGNLHEAQRLYQAALDTPAGSESEPTPYRGLAEAGLGQLFYEWNELAEARVHLQRAIVLTRPIAHWETLVPAYSALARLEQAEGAGRAALAALDELLQLRRHFGAPQKIPEIAALRATLHLRQGDRAAASRWSGTILSQGETPALAATASVRAAQLVALARVRISQERPSEALTWITRALQEAQASDRQVAVISLLILRALALRAEEQEAAAQESLARALLLARPQEYVRTFLDEGPALAPLLYETVAQGTAPVYAGRLLAALDTSAPALEAAPNERLVEPLTEREREVLALLAEGLTNREIAQTLSIALGTVKVHTYHIYGKLDVNNRTEAAARAQMLGIL